MAGRPAVVVVRDFDHREDLRALRRFIREQHPVLVAVDDGADALLEAGYRPDLLVVGPHGLATPSSGDAGHDTGHAVSERGLRSAREVVLHTDGRAARGAEALERVGVSAQLMPAAGSTGDVAVLLADLTGAMPIVTVGDHATLDQFLDGRRAGLGGTFLTRLRVGPRRVDAKTVPALYSGRVRTWHLVLVLLAGLAALVAACVTTPAGAQWWEQGRDAAMAWADAAAAWVQGTLP
jgi:uncharacterized membrane-anchored protein